MINFEQIMSNNIAVIILINLSWGVKKKDSGGLLWKHLIYFLDSRSFPPQPITVNIICSMIELTMDAIIRYEIYKLMDGALI